MIDNLDKAKATGKLTEDTELYHQLNELIQKVKKAESVDEIEYFKNEFINAIKTIYA
jgi:hypothetical protein